MKNVTYEGPENELETSDYLVVEGVRLPRGHEVKVQDDVAKAAAEVEGHNVVVSASKSDDGVPEAQPTVVNPPVEPEAESAGPAAAESTGATGASDKS